MLPPEARFRRFARAVTTEVGALDDSFLGRGRPLGVARVLNAVGSGRNVVADLRAYLRLDSGLMSRLLRSLEEEGLVITRQGNDDARFRVVELTAAGRRELQAYDEISDQRARTVLAKHSEPRRLLEALDLVATVLIKDQVVVDMLPASDPKSKYCLNAYYGELQERFDEGFDVARSRDPGAEQTAPPNGAFLVASSDGLPVGCVALVGNGTERAEIKRLWVSPTARGCGIASLLMNHVEMVARDLGIRELRLDTNRALTEAFEFYRRAGWRVIDRFNDDPYADHFFAKTVGPESLTS